MTTAVARFVWFVAANDRVRDIAFYDSRAMSFSDDGLTLAGSNFGQRVFGPKPGLNQFRSVLETLRRDPSSRRAAIAIYQPDDAVRESRDIPCALGLTYRIRNGALNATIIMRSSNVLGLFPYDFFEFSLLAEMLAAELRCPLGSVTHFASSAHFYDDDASAVTATVRAGIAHGPSAVREMPEMPTDPSPLSQARVLADLEWELRGATSFEDLLERADRELSSYWFQFFAVLCCHVRRNEAQQFKIEERIYEPFRAMMTNSPRRVE